MRTRVFVLGAVCDGVESVPFQSINENEMSFVVDLTGKNEFSVEVYYDSSAIRDPQDFDEFTRAVEECFDEMNYVENLVYLAYNNNEPRIRSIDEFGKICGIKDKIIEHARQHGISDKRTWLKIGNADVSYRGGWNYTINIFIDNPKTKGNAE